MTTNEVSTLRLYLMRLLFLLNFALLGSDVWPGLIHHVGAWEPMRGVAFSFWAALSALSALGLRYPLKMVPVLLMQFLYKSIWLLAIALPMWSAVRGTELAKAMLIGVVFDLVAIPWGYVLANYVKEPGDRWRSIRGRQS
ncbi:MAG: hypothetical protein QOJ16_4375 [Acidobacteriota bacterium]|nr:hypothetical protein [Acidobacteriota bacterium]